MKKLLFSFVAIAGLLLFASCGEDRDATTKQKVDALFSQAEKDVAAVDNFDNFFAFMEDFKVKKADLNKEIFETYATNDQDAEIPDEVSTYIYDRATAYNQVEAKKYTELFTPYVDNIDNAIKAYEESGKKDEALKEAVYSALEELMEYANYDNVEPAMQERCQALVDKMDELGL